MAKDQEHRREMKHRSQEVKLQDLVLPVPGLLQALRPSLKSERRLQHLL